MSSINDSSSSAFDPPRKSSLLSDSPITGEAVRRGSRRGEITGPTSGLAPSYLQANLIVLPSRYADDFTKFCQRNPVPCPLMGKSAIEGSYDAFKSWIRGATDKDLVGDIDIRTDAPKYMVYEDGELVANHITDVKRYWKKDHVAFLIGCSFSFEDALNTAGLPPPHIKQRRNVPMYKTKIPLCPAGVFDRGTYVVSMRAYRKDQIEKVREITRPYLSTHGEPIGWGWDFVDKYIQNIHMPDWGDRPLTDDGHCLRESNNEDALIPVFWGCGVTPQHAVMSAGLKGVVIGHAPGHMLVLDCRYGDLVQELIRKRAFSDTKSINARSVQGPEKTTGLGKLAP